MAVTPMMQQYLDIKSEYPDFLLFYRMGDFYELFGEDAKQAAESLNITLTQRRSSKEVEGVPMCGVPFHAAENYIAKLIKEGFKVALCEQTEDPKEAKKLRGSKALVKREVVRLYTGGTLTEESMLKAEENNYLVALTIYNGQIALAWADLSTGEFSMRNCKKHEVQSLLTRLNPSELILTSQSADDLQTELLPWQDFLSIVPETLFDTDTAKRDLSTYYDVKDLTAFGLTTEAEISASGALFAYLMQTQVGKIPQLNRPKVEASQSYMQLDLATRANLELTQTLRGEFKGSLLHALNRCVTAFGTRKLSQWITAPLQQEAEINNRLNAVETFINNPQARDDLRQFLKGAADMSRALSRLTLERGGPRDMNALRITLKLLPTLSQGLERFNSDLLTEIAQNFKGFDSLNIELDSALKADDLPLLVRDGGFIAQGYNAELDELKALNQDALTVLQKMEREEAEKLGVSSLKIKYNKVWGYFIEITKLNADKVPEHYIHRQTTANAQRFSTSELMDLERRIASAGQQALALEEKIYKELLILVNQQATELLTAAESLAELDVLTSAAEIAVERQYTRPEITSDKSLEIMDGRHPVVEQSVENFIANNAELSGGKLWLITGPNMAGKSTFLRQNALICLMAHMGFYIPATSAKIGVIDRIFTRIGASDDLARGQSTFMVEMVETANILNNATARSFVILDEIGRGTATYDGLSIAWSCVEHLSQETKCRALFATHYHELTVLEKEEPNILCYHVAVKEWQKDIVFLHQVKKGASPRSYGVHVGKLAGLPEKVTRRAEQILLNLEQGNQHSVPEKTEQLSFFEAPMQAEPDPSEVEERLNLTNPDDMTPRQAHQFLYELKGLMN